MIREVDDRTVAQSSHVRLVKNGLGEMEPYVRLVPEADAAR